MVWNIFKKRVEIKEAPIKRRPFVYDNTEKIENLIELYAEASDLVFRPSNIRKTK